MNKDPNDLLQLNNSYISEVSEMSMWEDLLIQKQKEIDMLRQQVHTLQELNSVLLGIKKPIVNHITPQGLNDLKPIQ